MTQPSSTNGAHSPVPITPDAQWQAFLAEGDALVAVQATNKWSWGDLAVRIAGPAGARGGDTTHEGRLARYAEELHARWGDDAPSYQVLTQYRLVATAWPPQSYARNIGMPYVVLRTLVSRTDRDQKLTEFVAHCEHNGITRGHYRALQAFLGGTVTPQYTLADRPEQAERALLDMAASGSADDTEAAASIIVRVLESDAVRAAVQRNTPVEQRQDVLRELVADPEVLEPVVNDRSGGLMSPVEEAVYRARAPFQAHLIQERQDNEQRAREINEQSMLNGPGLTNQHYINTMDARVRGDAVRYNALAHDLLEPMLQRHTARLNMTRMTFNLLLQSVQRCLDALPDAVATESDDSIIDAVSREAIDRFMLSERGVVDV